MNPLITDEERARLLVNGQTIDPLLVVRLLSEYVRLTD